MTPQPRPCPLLERESRSTLLRDAPPPWELRRCAETGFVYLANPPAQDLFRDEYAWEVTHERESRRRRRREPVLYALSGAAKAWRQRFLKRDKVAVLARNLVRDAARSGGATTIRIVDVGCAEGTLAMRIADRLPRSVAGRVEPIGIEISTHLARIADLSLRSRGGRCVHGTGIDGLEEIERCSVQLVVLSCILEHEISPLPLLRRCRERLTVDGRIIIKVPNHACVGRRLRGSRWCGYRWPDHVNYFTPRTLAATARAAGLKVVRMNAFDRWPLSDSLYAVLGRDPAASVATQPATPMLRRAA
ncbi:MAG: class I SAM-dependent methyltransferase [Planctomycetaceae bacterium]